MRTVTVVVTTLLALGLTACASTSTPEQEGPKLHLSQKAREMVMEEGAATAVERGYSTNSDLVCETRKKIGSHLVERVCYTRVEAAQARREEQASVRRMQRPDLHVFESRDDP